MVWEKIKYIINSYSNKSGKDVGPFCKEHLINQELMNQGYMRIHRLLKNGEVGEAIESLEEILSGTLEINHVFIEEYLEPSKLPDSEKERIKDFYCRQNEKIRNHLYP